MPFPHSSQKAPVDVAKSVLTSGQTNSVSGKGITAGLEVGVPHVYSQRGRLGSELHWFVERKDLQVFRRECSVERQTTRLVR